MGQPRDQSGLLAIRDQQLRVLGLAVRDAFIDALAAHVQQVFPGHAIFVRRPAGRRFLERCVAEAEGYGLGEQNSVALYADLVVALGAGFENESRHQWITAILRDDGLGGAAKMFLIYNQLPERCPEDPLPPPGDDLADPDTCRRPLVKLWPPGDWG